MKPLRRACLVLASALALVLLTGPGATAGPPTDQLRESIDRALKALADPDLRKDIRTRERRAALRGIANEAFDFEEMTKRALARHWHGRTPAEQKEFVQLFADLMERSYVSQARALRRREDPLHRRVGRGRGRAGDRAHQDRHQAGHGHS